MLKTDPNVRIEVDIRPNCPADGGTVPEAIEVKYSVNGGDPDWKVFKNG